MIEKIMIPMTLKRYVIAIKIDTNDIEKKCDRENNDTNDIEKM